MKTIFKHWGRRAHWGIRAVYLVLIAILAVYALFTYRQLQALRARPVTLPGYAFYVTDRPVKASTIQVIGTWLASPGSTLQPSVQTTNLECKREAMRCVESTAQVSTAEASYMETFSTVYDVEHWSDTDLTTKPSKSNCTERVIQVNFDERKAAMISKAIPTDRSCNEAVGSFSLGSNPATPLLRKP